MCKYLTLILSLSAYLSIYAADDVKLTGTVIGTTRAVNYETGAATTAVNTRQNAFDGDLNTFFASYERSYTWTGLDLGSAHVITRVGWSPRNDVHGEDRVLLGIFEGANSPDFMDAKPLYIITERGKIGTISYADVDCSKGFRYVRYVGPNDARCNIAEIEFYGHEGEGDDSHLYQLTNLPTVTIHTKNNVIPYDKEHEIEAQITIISEDGAQTFSEAGGVRERGNASREFPKKPYRIKFESKQNVLDAPAKAKKWTLINNYGDKTLMRNLLAFELSRLLGMSYTPYGRAVDVILNGEYKGCYQLCDQITINKKRVNITEMTPQDNSGDALTGGYLIEIDAYASQETSCFNSGQGNPVSIKSPDEDEITAEQTNYIKGRFNVMENNWHTYLDINTFLRHFLVGELSGNTDTYWSVYMYKERNDPLFYTGPVWDFDLAFDNDNRTYPVNNKSDYIYRSGGSFAGNMRKFVDNIVLGDADSREKLRDIWIQARRNGLNENYLTDFIDDMEGEIYASQALNFMRWPMLTQYVHQNPRIWGTYEAEVDNVRRFIKERIAWMDKHLGYDSTKDVSNTPINDIHINLDEPYEIFDIAGRFCGKSINGLAHGIYIIKQGASTKKIIINDK